MKRSEMIKIMVEGSKEYNPGIPVSEHQMNIVLEAMEHAGMEPPYNNGDTFDPNEWEPGPSVFDVKPAMTAEEMEAFAQKCREGKKGILTIKSEVDPEDIENIRKLWDQQLEYMGRLAKPITFTAPTFKRKVSNEQTAECPMWDSFNQVYCESDAQFAARIKSSNGAGGDEN